MTKTESSAEIASPREIAFHIFDALRTAVSSGANPARMLREPLPVKTIIAGVIDQLAPDEFGTSTKKTEGSVSPEKK